MISLFKKSYGLKNKILLNTNLSLIIVLFFTFLSCYYIFQNEYKKNLRCRLTSLAQTAALMIDAEDHKKLKTRADEKSEEYHRIRKVLRDMKKANPDIEYIYTIRKTHKKDVWEFVVDAEDLDSKHFSHIGDKYNVSEFNEMKKAFDGPVSDKDVETDNGSFMSGYAPITDNSGNVIAIVGLDISYDTILKQEQKILAGILVIFLISLSIVAYNTGKAVKRSLKPIQPIIDGIKQLKSGNPKFCLNIKTNDEFEEIAEVLNNTAAFMVRYQNMLEENLKHAQEQREQIFKVYRDVIYSVTQGKFNLINYEEFSAVVSEGSLYLDLVIKQNEDVYKTRQRVKSFLQKEKFSNKKITHILLCISEAMTNALKYGEEGLFRVRKLNDSIRFIITDNGSGMDFSKLPHMIFLEGFSTQISMGYGFTIIYKFADKVYLATCDKGTFLGLDFYFD